MKRKIGLIILAITLIMVTIISIFKYGKVNTLSILQYDKVNTSYSSQSGTTDEDGIKILEKKVELSNGYANTSINLYEPKITEGISYDTDGVEIIRKASELLGKKYEYAKKGSNYSAWEEHSDMRALDASQVNSIDCSGLVWWTLTSLKMKTSGFGFNNPVPVDTTHWLMPKGSQNYFREVKAWNYNKNSNEWNKKTYSTGTKAQDTKLRVKRGEDENDWKDINVLKINNPITSDLRYWEYYDKDENKKELPMGTVIISFGTGIGKDDHAWIYIGNLGTRDEAIAKLQAMDIKFDKENVIDYNNGCTHWRIESAGEMVTINNDDPDYGSLIYDENGKIKGVGPIWAFQVANDYSISGNYQMNVSKKDADSTTELDDYSDALEGAEIEIKQYKNNSSDETGESHTKTVNGNKTEVLFNEDSNITIDEISTNDTYIISEITAPDGYKINNGNIKLEVTKKIGKNVDTEKLEYQISKVNVYDNSNDSLLAELEPGNKEILTLKTTDTETGNVIGIEISTNAITVTYKDEKEEKDVNVVVDKKSIDGKNVNNVNLKYWVFDSEGDIPNENNLQDNRKSQDSMSNPFSIEKMRRGDVKYVWLTEESNNDNYGNGFFEITDDLRNEGVTCRYIRMKVECGKEDGVISVTEKELCQIKNNEKESLDSNCADNIYTDSENNQKNYVNVNNINVEDGNPAKITVPIINPYNSVEYSIGLGKKLAKGKVSEYSYPQSIEEAKDEFSDTTGLMAGAEFSVQQCFENSDENSRVWSDKKTVTTEDRGYIDITGDELPANYNRIWYKINETKSVEGGKLNQCVYYVKIDNYTKESITQNNVTIDVYKDPEINQDTNLPNSDAISNKWQDDDGNRFVADKDDGFMVYYGSTTKNIQFIMVDENITKKYNVNLAKINKDDINNFSLEELNSNSIKDKMVGNVSFDVKQESLTGEDKKTVTTVNKDYTSVYEDVSIKPDNHEIYTIKETSAPSEYVIYDKEITMTVYNDNKSDDEIYSPCLVYISVDFDGDGSINSNEEIVLTTNKNFTNFSSHNVLNNRIYGMIDDTGENVNITLILADEKYKGSYNIDLVKKELKDNQEDNYKNENAKFISTLSNAKYSIKQALNNEKYNEDDAQVGNNLPDVTTEKNTKSTIVDKVDIDNVKYPDTYWIEEKNSPASYNINKLKLKLNIYKYKKDNKYKIKYISIKDESKENGQIIYVGETLYISNKSAIKTYFSNYIVAVSLKENSVGDYTIEVTWRNDQPTYDIKLVKTNATTGEKVTASGDVTAKFDIKLYSDKEFNTLADFKNKDGDDLNQQEYETDDSEINLKNIIMPDVKTGETITNYLAITETSITDSSYKMFEGTLIIPIIFTRNENGKITQSKGNPYVINNITEKQVINGKINGDYEEIDKEKLIVLDTNNVVTVFVPNQKSGEISLQLIKEGKNLKGDTLIKYLNGAKFEISIDNVNENGDILENLYKTSSEQPEITGQYGNQGRIIVNNLPIKPGNILKINIKEVATIEGYTIPDELEKGITYTARVTTDVNNDLVISIDDTEYTESEIKLSNKWINIYVNNIKDAYPGKYKVNLTKKGEDGDILEGVTFERTGLINKDESSSDTKYNRIVDKKDFTTNSNGVTCITDELGESLSDLDGDDGYVKVPVKDYISASDEYVISESNLGDYENKYVKLNKPITVSIEKGAELHQNKAYANKILLSIDINDVSKEYVLINLLTNKYRRWTGTYSDFENVPEQDYNKDEISIDVQDENGLNHKILVSGELSEDCSETTFSIVVVNPRKPIPGQYKVNIQKVGTDGIALDGVVFHRIAQLNVDQTAETVGKTVDTDMDETSNGGYASVTKDVETEDSELITVSKDNYETIDKYEINEQSLGKNDGKYNKYPYSIHLVVEKEYEGYKASASKVKLTIDNKTEEIDLSNSTASSKKTITVKDSNDEEIDVVMNASIENNEVTITLTIENSELTSVPVEKRWVDGNDENKLRPDSIEVELKYKKDGNFVKYEKNGVENPVTLNLGNNWKYIWNKLPKNINGEVAEYTVEETKIPSGYTANGTIEGGVIVLTNSHTVTEIVNKSKRWKNVEDADLYGVDMELYKEGETTRIGDTKFVIGNGTATWDNQKKYDDEGNLIKYVVKETQAYYRTDKNSENWIELEEDKDYVADENGGVFINTLSTPGKYTIMLSKVDKDSNKAISGVKFNVNDADTNPTGNDGITYVNDKYGKILEVNIDKDNVDVTDTYKITEITTKDDYYKINGSLTVNVTKEKNVEDNNSITYKLNTVYFEDGTIDDNGVAKKTVELENGDKVEVTAEIVGSTVKITIPNIKKKGTYSLKLIKYKKGTQTPVAGAKFNIIGGNIGNNQLMQNNAPLSEDNYSQIITKTEPVAIWQESVNIRDIDTPDTYTLKEVDVGEDNTDMFVGFTEPIKITLNKNSSYNIESIGLTVGTEEAKKDSNGNLIFEKTIDNQTVEARLSLDKNTNTVILEVENPEKHGSFNFNLVKYIKGTTTPLNGAGFKIKIVNTDTNTCVQDSNGNDIDGTKEIFVENGQISIDNINIAKAGITYEITIEESTVPEGYIGLDGPITFTAVSESNADGKTYTLVANESTTIPNTRSVVVNENEINVEIDNSPFTEVEKEKLWENVKNANLYRVEMKLYKKDETNPIDNTTKYVIGNGKAIWENLDKYDADGNIIEYVVKETQAYYRTDENSENWIELEEGKDYVADEEEGVFINTVITPGKYTVMLSKVDKDSNKAIFGVTFKVNDVSTDPTGATGTTYVKDKDGNRLEVNIDKDNVGVTDTYEITEINLNNKENDYYKIAEPLKVNVTKKRIEENNQIIYKLDSVSFDNGAAKKTVELENGDKVDVTAKIVGSTVKITIPNIKKKGTYSLKLIKYKKGTQTPVAGAKFNIIGGNIGNNQLMQNNAPLSEDNYSQIITKTEPVAIWQESVNIRDIDTPDTYTLKEVDVGEDNTDMFVGFTEPIKITLNKNSSYNIESIGLTVGTEEAKKDSNGNLIFEKTIDNQTVEARLSLDKNTNTVILEVENPEKHGSFNFNLVKYIKGTTTPLNGAGFKIKIVNTDTNTCVQDSNGNDIDGTKEIFVENGQISIDNINIAKAGITYEITIEESTVPEGYIGLDGKITFTAVSESNADGKTYTLVPNKSTTIPNAKLVDVRKNEILVEVENKVKPTIHKGVKDVENQSSGYHNEITGDTYESEEDAKKVLHDWVINTTLPNGVDEYSIYEISDKIDDRLTYEGIASVKIIDGKNTVADLVEGTDYKVAYDEASRMLKITFIGQDQAISETVKNNIGKTIEVRFNTKFALDDNGNIIALNQSVPNQATLTYGNGSTVESEKPEVHTGGVGLFKYDEKTGKALSGAHFKIATSKENAEKGIFLKDTKGNDVEKITNEKGIAVFEGLEFGEDALNKAEYKTKDETTNADVYKYDWTKVETTYYIVETESPEGYGKIEEPIEAIVKKDNYNIEDITTLIKVGNSSNIYDLSLRKFITAVKDTAKGTEEEVTSRIPQVDLTKLASGESTTATYTHPKDPVLVHTTDIVTYTIRIYNEGPQDAYASIIKDDIPDGLQFVQYTEGDGSLNAEYRWKLVDENDNEVTDVSKAKYIVTDYLSKEQDKTPGANLLKGYEPDTMSELDYRDVKVQFKVTEPTTSDRILINYAQISKETDSSGNIVKDRDSTPNKWIDSEDDQDIEKVRVQYFDLALRKWVTQAIVTENGKTVVTETGHKAEDDPEEVVKVDLKKSKVNDVTVKFKYSIRITNEGEIAGEATEIRDDIPNGLKFVAEDNPDWREENGQIVTNKLEHTTLQPGESAEVEIVLTWINGTDNMGVMINTAEINKDHNEYGTPDIDSTPGNNVPGEDDIDDAPVMLTVKTESDIVVYMILSLTVLGIIASGVTIIRKKVIE